MLSGTSLNKLWEKTGRTKISGTPNKTPEFPPKRESKSTKNDTEDKKVLTTAKP